MPVGKYLDPADGQWKPLPVPPHVHPGGATRIPGEIVMFGGTTPPSGWLVCDGSEIKAADYPLLAAVLGTWGPDGAAFLPDLRGRFPVGVGAGFDLGAKGGSATHGHTADPMPTHDHDAGPLAAHTHSIGARQTTSDAHKHAVNVASFPSAAGGSHGHTTDSKGSHTHSTDPLTVGAAPAQGAVSGTSFARNTHTHEVNSGGGHTHGVTAGGSHSHTINPPASDSTTDAHDHTVPAATTGAMSAGTPRVGSSSAGTPTVHDTSSLPPWTGVNFIIFTGAA